MRHFALALLAIVLLTSSSGCCCFWKKMHCHKAWPGHCGNGCSDTHYLDPHGAQYGASCGPDCGHGCGHGCLSKLLGHGRGHGCGSGGCGNGCGDTCGCGNGCEQYGCGDKYWTDYHVPYTCDPCDCCGNWIGHGYGPGYQHAGNYGEGAPYYGRQNVPADYVEGHPGPQHSKRQVGPTKVVDRAAEQPQQQSIVQPSPSRNVARPTSIKKNPSNSGSLRGG